jgi:hypothetical protein
MARSVNTRSTARKAPVVPVDVHLFRTIVAEAVAEAVRDALPANEPVEVEPADTTPSASVLHDQQPVEPSVTSFTNRNIDISDPAQRFFSDVRRRPKPAKAPREARKPQAPVTVESPTAPEDTRITEALTSLEKARQVLSFVNPDLGGKSRKWQVNNNARKRANEAALDLVHEALRTLAR